MSRKTLLYALAGENELGAFSTSVTKYHMDYEYPVQKDVVEIEIIIEILRIQDRYDPNQQKSNLYISKEK